MGSHKKRREVKNFFAEELVGKKDGIYPTKGGFQVAFRAAYKEGETENDSDNMMLRL